jgi:hypothetical protein
MNRFHQILLIATFLPLCWLGMMAVHELGHVFGAVVSGGAVAKVVLYPLTFSRTELSENPHPLFVTWAGPMLGVLLPLVLLVVLQVVRSPWEYLCRFFAGFCMIANGAYIGAGSFQRVGDAGDMLRHGTPIWCLWLFGLLMCPAGVALWNGLGPEFGLGRGHGKVDATAAYVSAVFLILALALAFSLSPR